MIGVMIGIIVDVGIIVNVGIIVDVGVIYILIILLFFSSPLPFLFHFIFCVFSYFPLLTAKILPWQGCLSRNFNKKVICIVSMIAPLQRRVSCNFNEITTFALGKAKEQ